MPIEATVMPPHEKKLRVHWIRSNSRLLTVIAAAALLFSAFIAIVMTAPISEVIVGFRNTENADPVQLVVYLDSSRAEHLCIGGDGADGLKFHVSPGTHTVGVDFAYDALPNESIDYFWTTYVDFNGVARIHLLVDKDGIGSDILADFMATDTPLEQAVRDTYVMVPALTLAALDVVLVTAIWTYLRHGATI